MKISFIPFLLLVTIGAFSSCGKKNSAVDRTDRRVLLVGQPGPEDSVRFGAVWRELAGQSGGLQVDTMINLEWFEEDSLRAYGAVLLLDMEPDSFQIWHQADLQRYLQAGGGLVSLNTPRPKPMSWPWLEGIDSTAAGEGWFDRFAYDGGRVARLQDTSSLSQDAFADSLLAAVDYAIGDNRYDYSRATAPPAPRFHHFSQIVLDDDINEPMELAVTPQGRVVFIERRGRMKLYDPTRDTTLVIAEFDVCLEGNYEDGLLGLALDPAYGQDNHWLYLYYSPPCDTLYQYLSRFEFRNDTLDRASEIVMLRVGVQRETCCHSGGSVEFGPDGLLYLSTGDNTSSKESDGYSPLDERPGRGPFDAQKSSGNTHDLRGKILRIRPEADGSYSIPEGNLFPPDGSQGRPEIYVMGARNPFRITIDPKTNWLYWGDVGPDAGADSRYGPQSYDEWNQARTPGNYGWPYFVADNKAYPDRDFATDSLGPAQDPQRPENHSPYNTGATVLPPARPAMIWYPYGPSAEFPELGQGSRSAMAGPFHHDRPTYRKFVKFPAYYESKMFIYEWARSWIKVLTFDAEGRPVKIEPFLPDVEFVKPIDVEFGPDGALYVLEYGNQYFYNNPEAKLSRIEYSELNKPPVPVLALDAPDGAAPHTVHFSAAGSYDYDRRDTLSFRWQFTADTSDRAEGAEASFTYTEPGVYQPKLVVADPTGATAEMEATVRIGNEPPTVEVRWPGNRTFYFPNTGALPYEVVVSDPEDGTEGGVRPENISVAVTFLEDQEYVQSIRRGKSALPEGPVAHLAGKRLIDQSDCRTCHHEEKPSVGPTYQQVAERYKDRYDAVAYLAERVIKGGNKNWGEAMMAAHPQHSVGEVSQMIEYILSLADATSLLPQGTLELTRHDAADPQGSYLIAAAYTDGGANGIGPLRTRRVYVLRPPVLQAEDCDLCDDMVKSRFGSDQSQSLVTVWNGSLLRFDDVDLSGIRRLTLRVRPFAGGRVTARQSSDDGPVVGTAALPARNPNQDGGNDEDWQEISLPVKATEGPAPLFLLFDESPGRGIGQVDWIRVER